MADIRGKPLLAHVVELVTAFGELGVDTVQGSESNVLSRFQLVADLFHPDVILRITGDCPLLDPAPAEEIVRFLEQHSRCLFASNDTLISGWPDGTDVEAFRVSLLDDTIKHSSCGPYDREHVTHLMKKICTDRRQFSYVHERPRDSTSRLKLSVDTAKDLERVRTIVKTRYYFRSIKPTRQRFSLSETSKSAAAAGLLNVE